MPKECHIKYGNFSTYVLTDIIKKTKMFFTCCYVSNFKIKRNN
uniref:Uncharacterized protein n=1 Tax=Lepeophtheirus salmonis TaxID=72036 RepID=A0A0K2T480_LEPSM